MKRNKVGLKGQCGAWVLFKCEELTYFLYTLGPLETQVGKGAVSLNLTLRK